MKTILLHCIRFYRYFLSPFFGQHCRFYPTCSEYAQHALTEHGAVRGGWLSLRRLCRCHPWHEGGVDLVPQRMPQCVCNDAQSDNVSTRQCTEQLKKI